jgi:hypothetical protein
MNKNTDLPVQFWTNPSWASVTVTSKELRAIQLRHGGEILACGYLWVIKRQNLGGGIYKLTLDKKN